jgi:hypothetical protein
MGMRFSTWALAPLFLTASILVGCSHGCPVATPVKLEECRQRIARDCPPGDVSECPTYQVCVKELEGTCK